MATVKDLVQKYDRVFLATPENNGEILSFFSTISMDTTDLLLRYERSPDFFAFFEPQGLPTVVFLYRNDDGSLGGVSSVSTRNCLVNGKQVVIGYAGDLRLSPKMSRKTRVQWRKIYREFMENYRTYEDLGYPAYMFSVIMAGNRDAMQAFLKPTANPRYHKLLDFNSVNIFGKIFNPAYTFINKIKLKNRNYSMAWAEKKDLPALKYFLAKENNTKKLGFNYTATVNGELERRLRYWDSFNVTSVLLVWQNNTIIACIAPWSNGTSRRVVVEKAPLSLKVLGGILPLCGKKAIKVDDELTILYLTCLEIDSAKSMQEREEIFGFMVDFLITGGHCRQYNIVSFLDGSSCRLSKGIAGKGYVCSKQKSSLYQVLSPEEERGKRFLSVKDGEIVGFELATA